MMNDPRHCKVYIQKQFTVPQGSSYGEVIFFAKQLCFKVTSCLMFNPNLLCPQFGIKVWASKIAGCGFGGAGPRPPELWSRGGPPPDSGLHQVLRDPEQQQSWCRAG